MSTLLDIVGLLVLVGLMFVVVYVSVRLGSHAYYRSKGEHFRSVLKELNTKEEE